MRLRCILTVAVVLLGLAAGAQTPSGDEKALFEAARTSGLVKDYEAYLDAYPVGVYSEIAEFEMKWAAQAAPAALATPAVATIAPPPATDQTDITFTTPLTADPENLIGRSISELIKGSPVFPPIEGIPENMWKGQTCSNCHAWTKEALCDQGKTYSGPIGPKSLEKKHPYGGAFKAALKTFALEGCR